MNRINDIERHLNKYMMVKGIVYFDNYFILQRIQKTFKYLLTLGFVQFGLLLFPILSQREILLVLLLCSFVVSAVNCAINSISDISPVTVVGATSSLDLILTIDLSLVIDMKDRSLVF